MDTTNKMQEMRTIKLIGHINAIQPINITLPNTQGMPKSDGKPMVPASSLRGWLRHACHDGITKLFADNGKLLDVDTHYLIASGVDTGRVLEVKGQSTKVGGNQVIREKHPMLSLWGYWGLAGKFSVGSAVADSASALLSINGGARQHVFNRNEELHNFVDKSELAYLQDILSADKYSSEALVDYKSEEKLLKKEIRETTDKDRKAEINIRLGEIAQLVSDAKELRVGAKESVQRPLENIEAIDQGQTLPHRMILKSPSDLELNLALWSIAMGSLRAYIGGHSNANFGEITAHWEVKETSIKSLKPVLLGEVGFNDEDGFYCTVEGFDYKEITEGIVNGSINIGSFTEE